MRNVGDKVRTQYFAFGKFFRHDVEIFRDDVVFVIFSPSMKGLYSNGKITFRDTLRSFEYLLYGTLHHKFTAKIIDKSAYARHNENVRERDKRAEQRVSSAFFFGKRVNEFGKRSDKHHLHEKPKISPEGETRSLRDFIFHKSTAL